LQISADAADDTIELADKPGQMLAVSKIVSEKRANILSVHHERASASDINGCYLQIQMETRDFAHVEEIRKALEENGFKIVK
jgi:threonine dehydratase